QEPFAGSRRRIERTAPTQPAADQLRAARSLSECSRLVLGTPASRYSIWSARMRRLRRMKCSCRFGTYGTYSSGMPAISGERLAFLVLQRRHAVTELVHTSRPPRETGIT